MVKFYFLRSQIKYRLSLHEDDELFTKKAYKSNIYKEFIKNKIAPGEKASSSIGNMYSAS